MASHNKQAACLPQVQDKDGGTAEIIHYLLTKRADRAESYKHCIERATLAVLKRKCLGLKSGFKRPVIPLHTTCVTVIQRNNSVL